MKKIFILMILIASYSTAIQAENIFVSHHNNTDNYLQGRNNRHNKSDIPKDQLPSNITKYLDKNYPGCIIMISKQKGNGYFYVKIKYNQNANRPYYRNLVFDQNGNPVRG